MNIRSSFFGPLSISTDRGERVLLKSIRGQALIGLLALSRDHSRDRRQIEDMLWPDKPAGSAQTSLRQEVARIRRSFGTRDILISDGGRLRLNRAMLQFDIDSQRAANAALAMPADFLDGIDIPGPFEDWIRDMRRAMEAPAPPALPGAAARPLRLQVVTGGEQGLVPEVFLDRLVRSLTEIGPIEIELSQRETGETRTGDVRLDHVTAEAAGHAILRHAVSVPGGDRISWTAEWRGGNDDLWEPAILRQGYLAQQEVLSLLAQSVGASRAATAGIGAILDAFSLEPGRVAQAASQLARAHETVPHPAFLAWRAFLLTNQIVERQVSDPEATAEEALDLIWTALDRGGGNSTVLAIAAHVLRILDGDAELAAEFGRDAVRINPVNPLAWSSSANALVSLKQPDKARPLAARALAIGRNAPFRFWWEMNACAAEVMSGNDARGLRHARVAHRLNPGFRPPLRYLTALRLANGDYTEAETAMEKLQALEPDFELRLFHDPDYPVGTLRHSSTYDTIRHLA